MSPVQAVELFHIYFCRHLDQSLEKNLYAIKGGCNLRFFHRSIRYSEDLDIDVQTVAVKTLENKVDRILTSKPFQANLSVHEIGLSGVSKPKQTDTVQRWKIQIRFNQVTIPTKIEFSRRGLDHSVEYGPIGSEVINLYKMYPVLCSHYGIETAIQQKIKALAHRTETQARDIFDLDLLLKQGRSPVITLNKGERQKAIESAMSISFTDFQSQVVGYLAPEYQSYYQDEKIWDQLQDSVIAFLETHETD